MIFFLNNEEKVVGHATNDAPRALPYKDDLLKEDLETGAQTFEFAIPANHPDASRLDEKGFIVTEGFNSELLQFQVAEVRERHDSEGLFKVVYSEFAWAELNGHIIRPYSLPGGDARTALQYAVSGSRWQVGRVDFSGVADLDSSDYDTALKMIQDIKEAYGGELVFRVTMDKNKVTGRFVDLVERVGANNGKVITFDKNIVSAQRIYSRTEVATALIGLGRGDEEGNRLTFSGLTWTKGVDGAPADKPAGQDWVGDPAALKLWGVDGRHITKVFEYDTTNPLTLLQKTWGELQRIKNAVYQYEVEAAFLDALGWDWERSNIGDTTIIIDHKFEPALQLEARIVQLERSKKDPTKNKLVLGDYLPRLSQAGSIADIQSTLQRNYEKWGAGGGLEIIRSNTAPETTENVLWLQPANLTRGYDVFYTYDPAAGKWIETAPLSAEDINAEAGIYKQSSAPGHLLDRLWLDTGSTPNVLYRSTGSTWVKASPTTAADVNADAAGSAAAAEAAAKAASEPTIYKQATAPAHDVGRLWLDTSKTVNILYRSTGSAWVKATPTAASEVGAEVAFYKQTTAPAHSNGRLWIDTSVTPNVLKRSTGSAWVKVTPTTAAEVQADAAGAAAAAQAAAEAVARAEATAAETRANAYADGQITAEEQARIDQDAATLAAAKADAQTKADAAKQAAIDAAALDAATKANEAQKAAEDVAYKQAALAQANAEAYADGQVTAEETARINQAAANLEAAKEDAQAKADAAEAAANLYAISRGQNLVSNGTGYLKDNTNFSQFVFDGSQAPSGNGSFKKTSTATTLTNDDLMPINPERTYRLSVTAKGDAAAVAARHYIGLSVYDRDGLSMTPQTHMYLAGTLTTLAQPLNPGDTAVYLTDASKWKNSTLNYQRSITFWDYISKDGFAYPPESYSRNYSGSDTWLLDGIDYANNKINLRVPWAGAAKPAGTHISQTSSGSGYKYIASGNLLYTEEWKTYIGTIAGTDWTGSNNNNKFPPYAANVKLLILANRDVSAPVSTWYTAIELTDISQELNAVEAAKADATTKANAAQAAAEEVARQQAALAQTNAQAYADGQVTEEENARIAQAEANLLAAQNDATAKADAAKQAAIDAAALDAKAKADAAQAAAENVARAEGDLAEANAKAYADGVVDAEEQARIDEAAANLATAQADATSKANAAESAAKTYAETQASTAETNAKNYAEPQVIKQSTAPAHLNGRLWLDTSVTPNILKRSTGTAWVNASPTTASQVGAEATVYKQATAPAHSNGRLWLDTSVTPNILRRSTGTAWVDATPTSAGQIGAETPTAAQNKAKIAEYNAYRAAVLDQYNTVIQLAYPIVSAPAGQYTDAIKNAAKLYRDNMINTSKPNLINAIDNAIADGVITAAEESSISSYKQAYENDYLDLSAQITKASQDASGLTVGSINITDVARIGNAIYIGDQLSTAYKYIYFNDSNRIYSDGLDTFIYSDGDINLNSYGVDLFSDGGSFYMQGSFLSVEFANVAFSQTPAFNGGADFWGTTRFYSASGTNLLYWDGVRFLTNVPETGFMGIGAMNALGLTGVLTGVGVNFRVRKTYTPSSVQLTSTSAVLTASTNIMTANITPDGFWLYIQDSGTAKTLRYWRGYYNA